MDKALEIMKWIRPDGMFKHDWTSDRWSEEELNVVRSFDYGFKFTFSSYRKFFTTQMSEITEERSDCSLALTER